MLHAMHASLYITLRLRVCNCEHRPRKRLIYVFIRRVRSECVGWVQREVGEYVRKGAVLVFLASCKFSFYILLFMFP